MTSLATRAVQLTAHPATWIIACAAAEGIGMTASAAAARAAVGLTGLAALALIVAGGLIEGVALGGFQAAWLGRRIPGLSRVGWILTTVLVAGVGWSLASAPSALGGDDGQAPPVLVQVVGGAALGALMGALMGVAQALVLRGRVRHPWRWVSISALAWTPTMLVIFAGATLPDESWSTPPVIALGAATGLVAGAILGAVSLAFMPTLTGRSIWSGMLARLLRAGTFGLDRTLTLLRVTGTVSGTTYELPVQFAREGDVVVVFPGRAENKTWWRNLEHPSHLTLWVDGGWRSAVGRVVRAGDGEAFGSARAVYQHRWPSVPIGDDAVLVRIEA